MIRVLDGQIVFAYEENDLVVGVLIGNLYGDGVYLMYAVVSKPGAFLPALRAAIELARRSWRFVVFYVEDAHPYCGTLARLAKRYKAEPVDCDAAGVYYRLTF